MTPLEERLLALPDDPEAEPEFTRLLLASEVLVLGRAQGEGADAQLAVATWTDAHGEVVPFFTSVEMLDASRAADPELGDEAVEIACVDLWELLGEARMVLNPHGPVTRLYDAGETAHLLATQPQLVPYDDVELEVHPPAQEPYALHAELAAFLRRRGVVASAHLGWVSRSDGHRGWLLFLLADDVDAALAGLEALDLAPLLDGAPLDVTVIPADVTDHLLSGVPAFYPR